MGALTKVRKKFSYVLLAGVIMAGPSAVGTALADEGRGPGKDVRLAARPQGRGAL